jgi:hypothetical protein
LLTGFEVLGQIHVAGVLRLDTRCWILDS